MRNAPTKVSSVAPPVQHTLTDTLTSSAQVLDSIANQVSLIEEKLGFGSTAGGNGPIGSTLPSLAYGIDSVVGDINTRLTKVVESL